MANVDAFNQGFDAGMGKSKHAHKKTKDVKKITTDDGDVLTPTSSARPSAFKHGGRVRKTGYAKVHKNERVLTAREAKSYGKKYGKNSHKKRVTTKR